MPGFSGPRLPAWLAEELADGLGGVCLFGSNIDNPAQLRELTDAIHAANPNAVVATDEEGGDVTRLHHREGSPYPSMAYLGRLDDETLTETVAAAIGAELRAVGIDLNVAPDADVNSNPRNPVIGVRSFGADATVVSRHVAAYTRGLQSAGVGASAKHFPGHGDTATDSHVALPTLIADAATLDVRELPPFEAAVRAGTLAVMTSHLMVPAIDSQWPTTFSPAVLGELRSRCGFTGAIVSDALDMAGASAGRGVPAAAVLALAAGVDLLCLGNDLTHEQVRRVRDEILDALDDGRLATDRVFEAAARVGALAEGVRWLRASGTAGAPTPPALTPDGFWRRGPVPPMTAPLLLRLGSPASMAAGQTPWGIAEHLTAHVADALPGATCLTVDDIDALPAILGEHRDRPLVVQGRDLNRVEFLRAASAIVLERRPDALMVELGWPDHDGPARIDVVTYGSGRAAALALIQLLADGSG
ncbi:glycoside hydrolase family 3 N-terminal domain-containing protein [Micropruina sp.]|uniref:glycoside hydrolase family 3 N-terminal domain-containing protein n=1 Tax=Micropruina sp. TaxID=2737536 RepID=UPI0039E6B185